MGLLTFKRGVHPPEAKITAEEPIVDLEPKGLLVFPMSQHIGAPCVPVVKKGDRVLVGSRLGDPQGFVSAPVLCSVSGTVKNIGSAMTSGGQPSCAVFVESDGLYEEATELAKHSSVDELSADEIRAIIKEAGIVGMGGACFPTFIKLTPPEGTKIDRLIINAAECEPYLTCDYRLIMEDFEPIKIGLKALLSLFPEAELGFGIENNKPKAIEKLKKELDGFDPRVSLKVLKTKYPQGGEKQLIYAVTGRTVPAGKLPADVGTIVANVLTAYDIGTAMLKGRPSLKRIVTLSGDCPVKPGNYRVPLGMTFTDLLEQTGGFKEEPHKMIAGGPMMGMTLHDADVPISKGNGGLLAFSKKLAETQVETPCIRCGRCVYGCPMGLHPTGLDSLVRRGDYKSFIDRGGMNCIECGCCSYVCPANRYLAQTMREGKRFGGALLRRKS